MSKRHSWTTHPHRAVAVICVECGVSRRAAEHNGWHDCVPPERYIVRCLDCGGMSRCECYPAQPIGPCPMCDSTAVVMYEEAKQGAVDAALHWAATYSAREES